MSGLTLGGGHGYITRKYGLTIDNLIEADVVLSDGSYITANAVNSDIFWAISGVEFWYSNFVSIQTSASSGGLLWPNVLGT